MNTAAFLAALRARDVHVWAEGNRLKCSAPAGALTAGLQEELRARKHDILKFLHTADTLAHQQRAIIPLQPGGARVPVFAVAGHNGDVFCYRTLVQYLGNDQPFFGLQPPGLDGRSQPLVSVENLASYFATQIKAFRPNGPYVIAGYCAGGTIAFELARRLLRDGASVKFLVLLGAPYATAYRLRSRIGLWFRAECARITRHARALASLSAAQGSSYILEKLKLALKPWGPLRSLAIAPMNNHSPQSNTENQSSRTAAEVIAQRIKVQRATFAALRRYKPTRFPGHLILFLPCKSWVRSGLTPLKWRLMADHVEEFFGPNDCHTDVMLLEPFAPFFAELFSQFSMHEDYLACRSSKP